MLPIHTILSMQVNVVLTMSPVKRLIRRSLPFPKRWRIKDYHARNLWLSLLLIKSVREFCLAKKTAAMKLQACCTGCQEISEYRVDFSEHIPLITTDHFVCCHFYSFTVCLIHVLLFTDNWAMLYAQRLALKLGVPIHVCFCLVPKFLDATIRHYGFMLSGLQEVQEV